jgi:hypothetical protein
MRALIPDIVSLGEHILRLVPEMDSQRASCGLVAVPGLHWAVFVSPAYTVFQPQAPLVLFWFSAKVQRVRMLCHAVPGCL